MRRILTVLLTMLTALSLAVSAQPALASPPGQITIDRARSVTGDLGRLTVDVNSSYPIAKVTAQVIGEDGSVLATVDDFTIFSGSSWYEYTAGSRVQLAELGVYRVDVEATDVMGTHVKKERAGTLNYRVETIFEPLRSNRDTVAYDRRDVVVRGRLLGRQPATGRLEPVGGQTVNLVFLYWIKDQNVDIEGVPVTTDAQGRFELTKALSSRAEIWAEFDSYAVPGHLSAAAEKIVVNAKEQATRVKVNLSSRRILRGESVVMSGVAEWRSRDGWLPLAGARLTYVSGYWEEITTDADGRYSVTITPQASATIPVNYWAYDDAFKAASAGQAEITVVEPPVFASYGAARQDDGVVFSAVLDFPDAAPATALIAFEFSLDGQKWTRREVFEGTYNYWSHNFTGWVAETRPGHWRVKFLGGENYPSVISRVVTIS
ncbi:hypothetical protein [Herbidospora sp. RD11066]